MAKKKTKVLAYIKYGALAFAVIGLIMTLLPFVKGEGDSVTGLQVIFGYSEQILLVTTPILSFSFMALLTVLLPVIGACSIFFKNRLVRMIGAFLMLVGAVLCFLILNFVVFVKEPLITPSIGLGIGAILCAISFLLGTACCAYSVVEKI